MQVSLVAAREALRSAGSAGKKGAKGGGASRLLPQRAESDAGDDEEVRGSVYGLWWRDKGWGEREATI